MEVESCQSGKEIKLAFAGSCDDKPKVTEKPGMIIKTINNKKLNLKFNALHVRRNTSVFVFCAWVQYS